MKHIIRILIVSAFMLLLPSYINAQTIELVDHEIQPNETLESIATMYGLSVDQLKKLNPNNYKFVYAGFTLKIPAEAKNRVEIIKAEQKKLSTQGSCVSQTDSKTSINLAISEPPQTTANPSLEKHDNNTSSLAATSMSGISDKDQYRRSSLCLILLTHRDKKYAAEMERVFRNFPLPARYNEHNISDLRVISVRGKQSKSDIERLLRNNYVAQKIVGKWFNRNTYTGHMNMDLIHERGGYGASYADYQRSQSNVRGSEMLRDEGIELLQSTFVLVCDMDYIDKKEGAKWAAFGTALLSIGAATMSAVNQQQAYMAAYQGDYNEARRKQNAANAWHAGSAVGQLTSAVVADIGGFRVKMKAYLYKLRWDDNMTQMMYRDYWCDNHTSSSEAQSRKKKFDNASHAFTLEYVGKYQAISSKTILRSWSDEKQVILDVCKRCVNKGIRELAQAFPIFKPRAPFYFEGTTLYSHIGSKEDVSHGKKYEIVQPYKDKNGQIRYKRVGVVQAGSPWDNNDIRFDQYFDPGVKGTMFYYKKASVDLHTPGLQLRDF